MNEWIKCVIAMQWNIIWPQKGIRASLIAQLVKNLPAMWETWVESLGWEDPLEKGKGTHSSILAWRISWTDHGVAKGQTGLSDFHFQKGIKFQHMLQMDENIMLSEISQTQQNKYCMILFIWST